MPNFSILNHFCSLLVYSCLFLGAGGGGGRCGGGFPLPFHQAFGSSTTCLQPKFSQRQNRKLLLDMKYLKFTYMKHFISYLGSSLKKCVFWIKAWTLPQQKFPACAPACGIYLPRKTFIQTFTLIENNFRGLSSSRKDCTPCCFVFEQTSHEFLFFNFFSRCIFNSVRDVMLTQQEPETVAPKKSSIISSLRSRSGREDLISPLPFADTFGSRFRKISDIVVQASKESVPGVRKPSILTSTLEVRNAEPDWHSHLPNNLAVAVTSEQGETLELITKVTSITRLKITGNRKGHDRLIGSILAR